MLDEAGFLRLVRGETQGMLARGARGGLSVAAAGYRVGVSGRNLAFSRGWKKVEKAQVPVISVGNLTLGGTGKTPMVEWLGRRLRFEGCRVAILSRGYGGTAGLNDEGRVLEENLPDVPHLQDADRVNLARIAVEELESEILVLDDGFQHRRLGRDLDLVLLDALEPFGLGRLFPRGLLREPVSSLRRADVVVLSRADLIAANLRSEIRTKAERAAGPLNWVEARHAPLELVGTGCDAEGLEGLSGKGVAAFCGIGNPEGFRRTLEGLGTKVMGFRAYPDHHSYSASDVAELTAWARGLGADLALTTQKDLVKLRTAVLGAVPLRALRVGLEIMDGLEILDEAIQRLLAARV